ncbi:hypothetical protein [Paraferrimonas sedimenticola]|uniref:Uncharacterized protein n=1 Tax=Paraferrimonas sedimenticola TaxID=375674 RepID=A0AA37RV15_9GAMM|nr:hypothetical protein [Paraferrimonas sedimenticola]GLP95342.1 hypothetical protein GCM10007895_06480 [Paraferrimonas sedimenticola]
MDKDAWINPLPEHQYQSKLDLLLTELCEASAGVEYGFILNIKEFCWRFLETGETRFIDQAVINCAHWRIPITPILAELVMSAAVIKMSGNQAASRKTKCPVEREISEGFTIRALALLTEFCGLTLHEASVKAASALSHHHPDFTKKSSTIEKLYAAKAKDLGERLRSRKPDGWSVTEQQKFLSEFPQTTPQALLGERR